jgi:hypothetical protein
VERLHGRLQSYVEIHGIRHRDHTARWNEAAIFSLVDTAMTVTGSSRCKTISGSSTALKLN